jgi:preprotein translocase SecE subunit
MANTSGKEGLFQRISRFLRECWMELKKTSWPNSDELKKSTLLVIAAIIVITVWIGGLDFLLGQVSQRVLQW